MILGMAPTRNTRLEAAAGDDPEVEVEIEVHGKAPRRTRRRGRPPESKGNTEVRILNAARIFV